MAVLKVDIESAVQFSVYLLQVAGMFIVKPDMFDLYHGNESFVAGNFSVYVVLLVGIIFIFLSLRFSSPQSVKYWVIAALASTILFLTFYFTYNTDLGKKTFQASMPGSGAPIRVIKGNNYKADLVAACPLLQKTDSMVREIDVIQSCADIKQWNQIDNVWYKKDILKNVNILLLDYYICLLSGSISLICGIQAMKSFKK